MPGRADHGDGGGARAIRGRHHAPGASDHGEHALGQPRVSDRQEAIRGLIVEPGPTVCSSREQLLKRLRGPTPSRCLAGRADEQLQDGEGGVERRKRIRRGVGCAAALQPSAVSGAYHQSVYRHGEPSTIRCNRDQASLAVTALRPGAGAQGTVGGGGEQIIGVGVPEAGTTPPSIEDEKMHYFGERAVASGATSSRGAVEASGMNLVDTARGRTGGPSSAVCDAAARWAWHGSPRAGGAGCQHSLSLG